MARIHEILNQQRARKERGKWGAALMREESRARELYSTDHGQWVIAAIKVKDLRAVVASMRCHSPNDSSSPAAQSVRISDDAT